MYSALGCQNEANLILPLGHDIVFMINETKILIEGFFFSFPRGRSEFLITQNQIIQDLGTPLTQILPVLVPCSLSSFHRLNTLPKSLPVSFILKVSATFFCSPDFNTKGLFSDVTTSWESAPAGSRFLLLAHICNDQGLAMLKPLRSQTDSSQHVH